MTDWLAGDTIKFDNEQKGGVGAVLPAFFVRSRGAGKLYGLLFTPLLERHTLTQLEADIILFLANNPEYDTARDIVEKRHLAKTLAWETLYVSLISILGGIVFGLALDKAMFLLIAKIVSGKISLGFFYFSTSAQNHYYFVRSNFPVDLLMFCKSDTHGKPR